MSDSEELSPFLRKIAMALSPSIFWFGRVFLKWNRLEHIQLIPLGTPIADVITTYGDPIESTLHEDLEGAMCYTFQPSAFHEVIITEWKGVACSIVYWSSHSAPIPDLKHVLSQYVGDSEWNDTEPGYWYFRKDGAVRLWCSVAPAIGVATTQYLELSGEAKRTKQTKDANKSEMATPRK